MKAASFTALVLAAGYATPAVIAQTPGASVSVPAVSAAPAVPGKIVYAVRLPTAQELTSAAAAQGLAIGTIEQTSAEVIVTYRSQNGQLFTVSYQVLPAPGAVASAPPAAAPAPAPVIVYTEPAATRVVYTPAPYPVYCDPFYYPWGWYPGYPSLVVGFGLGGDHHRGRH